MTPNFHVGQRVSFQNALCTVRYFGPVEGTAKDWLGVEWDDPLRGKHDGQLKGRRYFTCLSKSKTAASFVRPTRSVDYPQSFVEAVQHKYGGELDSQGGGSGTTEKLHVISGKTVEEVGFDKIRQQLAQLKELRIVIVDGLWIDSVETESLSIREVCPKIVELDLSRNLFERFEDVVRICGELDELRSLRINGNRFSDITIENEEFVRKKLKGITDLELDDVLLPWADICSITQYFTSLKTLTVSSNYFTSIDIPLSTPNLRSLTLEYNSFHALSDLSPLTSLESLGVLLLKGNRISQISQSPRHDYLVFGTNLRYIDLSYNNVSSWPFIDSLPSTFPGMEALRFSHNPIYEVSIEDPGSAKAVEECYMLTLARLGNLKTLNFSNITTADRTNAEMYYLSRIGKALAEVSETEEASVLAQHRRYAELVEIYGEPNVARKLAESVNPNLLEARLIKFSFYMPAGASGTNESPREEVITKEKEIPKSFDVYRVKGVVGREFGVPPMSLHLVWETGEWDPVAGYEDEEEDSDDDDGEDEVEQEGSRKQESARTSSDNEDEVEKGKWMEREVVIEDGTRQIGFWVDGNEARVRVELR